jgi:hypothetical protein
MKSYQSLLVNWYCGNLQSATKGFQAKATRKYFAIKQGLPIHICLLFKNI